jgi:hypothetical protein
LFDACHAAHGTRICLSLQQPEVRRAVYDGMPVLLAADPSVQVG